jgi:hypothetical protein
MTSAAAPAVSVRGVSVEDVSFDRRRLVAEVEAAPGHPWHGELQTPS